MWSIFMVSEKFVSLFQKDALVLEVSEISYFRFDWKNIFTVRMFNLWH